MVLLCVDNGGVSGRNCDLLLQGLVVDSEHELALRGGSGVLQGGLDDGVQISCCLGCGTSGRWVVLSWHDWWLLLSSEWSGRHHHTGAIRETAMSMLRVESAPCVVEVLDTDDLSLVSVDGELRESHALAHLVTTMSKLALRPKRATSSQPVLADPGAIFAVRLALEKFLCVLVAQAHHGYLLRLLVVVLRRLVVRENAFLTKLAHAVAHPVQTSTLLLWLKSSGAASLWELLSLLCALAVERHVDVLLWLKLQLRWWRRSHAVGAQLLVVSVRIGWCHRRTVRLRQSRIGCLQRRPWLIGQLMQQRVLLLLLLGKIWGAQQS